MLMKYDLRGVFAYVCVDTHRNLVPAFVTSVPTIFVASERRVLRDDKVTDFIESMISAFKERHRREEQARLASMSRSKQNKAPLSDVAPPGSAALAAKRVVAPVSGGASVNAVNTVNVKDPLSSPAVDTDLDPDAPLEGNCDMLHQFSYVEDGDNLERDKNEKYHYSSRYMPASLEQRHPPMQPTGSQARVPRGVAAGRGDAGMLEPPQTIASVKSSIGSETEAAYERMMQQREADFAQGIPGAGVSAGGITMGRIRT